MPDYVGLAVEVALKDGSTLTGTVEDVHVKNQHLRLSGVTFVYANGMQQSFPSFEVAAVNIANLQITSADQEPSESHSHGTKRGLKHAASTATIPASAASTTRTGSGQAQDSRRSAPEDPAIISFTVDQTRSTNASAAEPNSGHQHSGTTSTHRQNQYGSRSQSHNTNNSRQQSHRSQNRNSADQSLQGGATGNHRNGGPGHITNGGGRRPQSGWAGQDVNNFKHNEFDFEGNLGKFDKKKVFDEIKNGHGSGTDESESEYLHRPKGRDRPNIPKETFHDVFSPIKRGKSAIGHPPPTQKGRGIENYTNQGSWSPAKGQGGDRKLGTSANRFRTGESSGKRVVPTATPVQKLEALRISSIGGIGSKAIMESAGRALAAMVLRLVGGGKRLQARHRNSLPVVVVMVGRHWHGAIGLVAARHLGSRGVRIRVFDRDAPAGGPPATGTISVDKSFSDQMDVLRVTDAYDLRANVSEFELPDATDMIVDALMGFSRSVGSEETKRREAIGLSWAKANRSPVVSLEVPMGVDPHSGLVPKKSLSPKYTLALGIPCQGLVRATPETVGSVMLADVGITASTWRQVGIEGFPSEFEIHGDGGILWEDKWSVPLFWEAG